MATSDVDLAVEYKELLDPTAPLDERIRCLYRLKEAHAKTLPATRLLLQAVDTTDSVLLQHELVYNVGQFGRSEVIPDLEKIIHNLNYDVVTRHEAIEALGAIGDDQCLPVLKSLVEGKVEADLHPDTELPIYESAVLALCRLTMKREQGDASVGRPANCPFVSVDPSPAFSEKRTVAELEAVLNDASGSSLWDRYRAMFSLRNIGTVEAVQALCRSLRQDKSSCLFRHEIAFVLGQLEDPSSEAALCEALCDESEHAMVRHEAAEALGAIAEKASWNLLERYSSHHEGIVKDSCVVALDMHKYWSQFKPKTVEESA